MSGVSKVHSFLGLTAFFAGFGVLSGPPLAGKSSNILSNAQQQWKTSDPWEHENIRLKETGDNLCSSILAITLIHQ